MALFKKRERFLGIDISPSAVKLIELSRNGQRYQVEAIAMEPLPEGAVENRNPTDMDKIGPAIKRVLKSSGASLKKAAVAVPTSSVITRTITMPTEFSEDEIEANIQIEAAQYIPFPIEEIHLDFQVQPSQDSKDSQDIMIVASRRENVDLREEALREAGLKAVLVDVEAYALENTFQLMKDDLSAANKGQLSLGKGSGDTRTALIDMGSAITTLYVFQGDKVIFTREQSFGCDQLTLTIAETYDLPKDRAELAKRSGELSEDYSSTILAPFMQEAAEQIGNALQFFFSSSHYNSIDNLILMGGGGMVQGLDKAVANVTGTPTIIGNPFESMTSAKRVNRRSLLRDAPLFGIACGLALRSFD